MLLTKVPSFQTKMTKTPMIINLKGVHKVAQPIFWVHLCSFNDKLIPLGFLSMFLTLLGEFIIKGKKNLHTLALQVEKESPDHHRDSVE